MSETPPKQVGESDRVRSVELTDGERTVTVTKLVSMGELLLVECEGQKLRLDAMLLEGISWQQDADGIAEFVQTPRDVLDDPVSSYENELREVSEEFTIANEYTTVRVGTGGKAGVNGLQIRSEKGVSVLGVQTLAAMTASENTRRFSEWFQTPIGPEQPL
jgi:hypothetical protein